MDPAERAEAYFDQSFNCAQSVFAAACDAEKLDIDDAMRIAACFGGGMRKGEVCGAVTGALMALGLRESDGTPVTKPQTNRLGAQFMDAFCALHGACRCRDLLGYDISTPEGAERMAQHRGHDPRCREYVRSAAMLIEEIAGREGA